MKLWVPKEHKIVLLPEPLPVINVGTGSSRYWVGGKGDWNSTQNWSEKSNGPGGASVPTSSDEVCFDQNCGKAAIDGVEIEPGDQGFFAPNETFAVGRVLNLPSGAVMVVKVLDGFLDRWEVTTDHEPTKQILRQMQIDNPPGVKGESIYRAGAGVVMLVGDLRRADDEIHASQRRKQPVRKTQRHGPPQRSQWWA